MVLGKKVTSGSGKIGSVSVDGAFS